MKTDGFNPIQMFRAIDASAKPVVRPAAPPPEATIVDRQRRFGDAIARPHPRTDLTPEQRAYGAAADFVAAAFIEPVLKQMRKNTFAAPPFAPGQGEQQLRALGDTQAARQIASAARFPLVERIASDLLFKQRQEQIAAGTTGATAGATAGDAPPAGSGAGGPAPAPRPLEQAIKPSVSNLGSDLVSLRRDIAPPVMRPSQR